MKSLETPLQVTSKNLGGAMVKRLAISAFATTWSRGTPEIRSRARGHGPRSTGSRCPYNAIKKVLRSKSASRIGRREHLYVIESPSFAGIWIYTKGTIRKRASQEVFYVFVSSKISQ